MVYCFGNGMWSFYGNFFSCERLYFAPSLTFKRKKTGEPYDENSLTTFTGTESVPMIPPDTKELGAELLECTTPSFGQHAQRTFTATKAARDNSSSLIFHPSLHSFHRVAFLLNGAFYILVAHISSF